MQPPESSSSNAGITVYWRPGCGFCSRLRRELDRRNVPHHLVNIRDDPSAAAFVPSVAHGNETVPIVAIGQTVLVNPGIDAVLAAAMNHAPSAVPAGYSTREIKGIARVVSRLFRGDR